MGLPLIITHHGQEGPLAAYLEIDGVAAYAQCGWDSPEVASFMFHIIPPLKVEGTGPWIGKGVRASAMEEDSDCLWGWLQWRSCKPNEMGPVVAEAEEALCLFILDMTEPRTC